MVGSILPGWMIDSGAYRPRRRSREAVCPVSHTELRKPCASNGVNSSRTSKVSGETVSVAIGSGNKRTSDTDGLLAGRGAGERDEIPERRQVPAGEQPPPTAGIAIGFVVDLVVAFQVCTRVVFGQRNEKHGDVLVVEQPGGAGGGDDGRAVA